MPKATETMKFDIGFGLHLVYKQDIEDLNLHNEDEDEDGDGDEIGCR